MATTDVIALSLDSDFNELQDKDRTVELIGFIQQLQVPLEVGQNTMYKLLKFTLSNSGTKKIQCLIWGDELIRQYQAELVLNRIVHIDGAHCKSSMLSYAMESQQFVPFELIVQKSTILNFLGTYHQTLRAPQVPVRRVTFENINEANGKIIIEGYVKSKFVLTPSRFENASYGCGSITDGEFKVTVHVVNYVPINIAKGARVTVVGEVNTNQNQPLTITCSDVNSITVHETEAPLPPAQLLRVVKTPKRKVPTV